jgi:hypothetical protein
MHNLSSTRIEPRDLLLVPRIAGFSVLVPLLMRLPLDRLDRLLEPARRPAAPGVDRARWLAALVDVVLSAERRYLRLSCLTRGLTRYYLLRRAGVDVSLCFGIGEQDGGTLAGHCWLVVQDEPFLEARDPRPMFTEFYRFPSLSQAGATRTFLATGSSA